jgi:putative MATE family efflux protein
MITGNDLLARIRTGEPMTTREQLMLILQLGTPSILAQLSTIVMEYIDAAMVGSLGANAAASIGLVSTSSWLVAGLCSAAATGFSVQVAHRIGAGHKAEARNVLRQSMLVLLVFSLALMIVGCAISGVLPQWLGGTPAINHDASVYFFIFSLVMPVWQFSCLASSMLRCSGNMLIPSLFNVLMCVFDVFFNFLFIFPSRVVSLFGLQFYMPGAGLGVAGAAIGSVLAYITATLPMLWYLFFRSPELRLNHSYGRFRIRRHTLVRALHISLPMGCEHIVMCGAQIMTTVIVAPLGVFAIAANSFAITAESLCYMPGYGIGDAATTLVGQSIGARRRDLTRSFAHITVGVGMLVMTFMGIIMYVAAPLMMSIMTPVPEIRELGVMALRIEAYAEPMFAASIVAYGVFVGAGDTLRPACMNLGSIWAVRLSLAALLAPRYGLKGVWIAMCIELCFRGFIFLSRLHWGKWLDKAYNSMSK